MPYRSINPATGEVLKTFTKHTDADMLAALDAGVRAFRSWSATPIAERSTVMHNAAKLLLERKDALARRLRHSK
jgi:succinate-semialdehyde dehydrogenase/glutarate-semialdehyde dehydrogenase